MSRSSSTADATIKRRSTSVETGTFMCSVIVCQDKKKMYLNFWNSQLKNPAEISANECREGTPGYNTKILHAERRPVE